MVLERWTWVYIQQSHYLTLKSSNTALIPNVHLVEEKAGITGLQYSWLCKCQKSRYNAWRQVWLWSVVWSRLTCCDILFSYQSRSSQLSHVFNLLSKQIHPLFITNSRQSVSGHLLYVLLCQCFHCDRIAHHIDCQSLNPQRFATQLHGLRWETPHKVRWTRQVTMTVTEFMWLVVFFSW